MAKKRKIIVVLPAPSENSVNSYGVFYKKKAAAYARVSTNEEQQLLSYSAQVDYYLHYIASNPNWDFVKVYTDVDTPYGQNPKSP